MLLVDKTDCSTPNPSQAFKYALVVTDYCIKILEYIKMTYYFKKLNLKKILLSASNSLSKWKSVLCESGKDFEISLVLMVNKQLCNIGNVTGFKELKYACVGCSALEWSIHHL